MIAKHFFFSILQSYGLRKWSSSPQLDMAPKQFLGWGQKQQVDEFISKYQKICCPPPNKKKKRKLAKSWLPKFKYADCCSTLKTECKQGHNIFGNAHYQYLLSVTLLKMFVCGCRLPERFLANVLWLAPTFFFVYAIVCTSTSVLSVSLPSVQWASKVPQWHLY